jgi:hypothetical protein
LAIILRVSGTLGDAMATDGDIDCSAYSKSKIKESLQNIDRNRFPKNFQKLTARLKELEEIGDSAVASAEFDVQDSPEMAADATRRGIGRGLSWGGLVPPLVTLPVTAVALGFAAYRYDSTLGAAILVAFVVGTAQLYVLRPLMAKRLVKERSTRRLSVSDECLIEAVGGNSHTTPWARYRDISEHPEYFLMGSGPRWNWIPKAQMPPEAVACLRKVIAERVA